MSKTKKPRRQVLCRVKMNRDEDSLIVYRDGYCRWSSSKAGNKESYFEWKLAHSDMGPMFIYKDYNYAHYEEECYWETDWNSGDKYEIHLAQSIAKALVDLEMDNVLKGDKESDTSK